MRAEENRIYYPTDLFLKMTDYCPNNCMAGKYCFAGNTPDGKQWADKEKMSDVFHQAAEAGIRNMAYVSCEPFADFELLLDLTKRAKEAGLRPRFLDTSGFYVGRSLDFAVDRFKRLRDAGFDMAIEEDHIGTDYNGIDVSVDQFHPQTAEECFNAIYGALNVFRPTIFVNMRITHASPDHDDRSKKNQVIRMLIDTGEVSETDVKHHEIVFTDGSQVHLTHLPAYDWGLGTKLFSQNPAVFEKRQFSLGDLGEYKDLREYIALNGALAVSPFHKIYVDPDGTAYPDLSRARCLSGGNVFVDGVENVVRNIEYNPLLPVILARGLAGLLKCIERSTGVAPSRYAVGPTTIGIDQLYDDALMNRVKEYIVAEKVDETLRQEMAAYLFNLSAALMPHGKTTLS